VTTPTTVQVQIQLRADTAANWASENPTLLANEVGLETDTKKIKVGNGSTAWNSLAYFPSIVTGGTVLGNLEIGTTGTLTFEGSTADGFETTLAVTDPTADRTITLPDQSGTVVVTGNASIVDADIAANAEIAVSKLADGAARQLLQTDAAGTGVEWTDNVDVPGTLDVTSNATFDANVTIEGDLTVNGTTTTIDTETLLVKDKNIELAVVDTPTDTTADGGGITLKGATDKTLTWSDTTDAWTSNQVVDVPAGSVAAPSLIFGADVNSGIYSPGADQVAISTGGTQRLLIEADGDINIDSGGVFYDATNNRLAIGTTSPGKLLAAEGSTAPGISVKTTSASSYSTNEAINDANDYIQLFANGSTRAAFGALDTGETALVSSKSLSIMAANANQVIKFATGGSTERARLDSSGRLLVGTSSSTGNSIAQSNIHSVIKGDNAVFSAVFTAYSGTTSPTSRGPALAFQRSRGTTDGSFVSVANGDYLGGINFYGANGSDFSNLAAAIFARVDGIVSGGGADDMPGRLVFSTTADGASSPTERMTIDSKGSTTLTSPSLTNAALYVNSTGTSNFQRGIIITFPNRTPNDANSYFWSASDSTTSRAVLMSNGGLHNYSANNVNLSDRNAKKDITPAAGTWDCLKGWEIVNFRYKDQPDDADLNLGVIAQQIAESCPEVVTVFQEAREATETEPAQEKRIGVKDQQMVWMAIKALQEAQLRIETLEAEVAALKAS
jgi:hypothetical protein